MKTVISLAEKFIRKFAGMMYTQKQILNFLSKNRQVFRRKFHITKIGLFGSYARNEQTDISDIDLVVEFEENTNNLYDIKIAVKQFIKEELKVDVDLCREKYIKSRYKNRIINEAVYVD